MDQLSYRRHRFPPPIIQHAIWLYLRFTLSYRDIAAVTRGAALLMSSADEVRRTANNPGRGESWPGAPRAWSRRETRR
jgi:transposase-like protein